MDNPEITEVSIRNGQSRDNRSVNQEWTIQRKQKCQSGMDNPETQLAQDTGKQNTTQKIKK